MKYFVVTFRAELNEHGEPVDHRCPGYFDTYEKAEQCIMENWGAIYEDNYYSIVLIEPIDAGLYAAIPGRKQRTWFEAIPEKANVYTGNFKVREIDEPKWAKNIIGYAIG
ncbi:MAG: hypothetical protein KW793_04270 [Candidatus Doudnabacteria bacterium]|nr:hypothetical protein [Candidatus Doudnabacteria bacterium]